MPCHRRYRQSNMATLTVVIFVTSFEGWRRKEKVTNLGVLHHKLPRVFTVKDAFNVSAAAVERTATIHIKHLNQVINDLSSLREARTYACRFHLDSSGR